MEQFYPEVAGKQTPGFYCRCPGHGRPVLRCIPLTNSAMPWSPGNKECRSAALPCLVWRRGGDRRRAHLCTERVLDGHRRSAGQCGPGRCFALSTWVGVQTAGRRSWSSCSATWPSSTVDPRVQPGSGLPTRRWPGPAVDPVGTTGSLRRNHWASLAGRTFAWLLIIWGVVQFLPATGSAGSGSG